MRFKLRATAILFLSYCLRRLWPEINLSLSRILLLALLFHYAFFGNVVRICNDTASMASHYHYPSLVTCQSDLACSRADTARRSDGKAHPHNIVNGVVGTSAVSILERWGVRAMERISFRKATCRFLLQSIKL